MGKALQILRWGFIGFNIDFTNIGMNIGCLCFSSTQLLSRNDAFQTKHFKWGCSGITQSIGFCFRCAAVPCRVRGKLQVMIAARDIYVGRPSSGIV